MNANKPQTQERNKFIHKLSRNLSNLHFGMLVAKYIFIRKICDVPNQHGNQGRFFFFICYLLKSFSSLCFFLKSIHNRDQFTTKQQLNCWNINTGTFAVHGFCGNDIIGTFVIDHLKRWLLKFALTQLSIFYSSLRWYWDELKSSIIFCTMFGMRIEFVHGYNVCHIHISSSLWKMTILSR